MVSGKERWEKLKQEQKKKAWKEKARLRLEE